MNTPIQKASKSVIRVTEGRGFVVRGRDDVRYIVTAAHCLTSLRWEPMSDQNYKNLLGRLGAKALTIWAQCLFIDPVSDLAVLGGPDDQRLPDQAWKYEKFIRRAIPLSIRLPEPDEQAWLFALDGKHWFSCTAEHVNHMIWIEGPTEPIRGGMSGSPVLGADGKAIGVCCISGGGADLENHREGGPNPALTNLPVWLWEDLTGEGRDGNA
jgi:hypothetical protein